MTRTNPLPQVGVAKQVYEGARKGSGDGETVKGRRQGGKGGWEGTGRIVARRDPKGKHGTHHHSAPRNVMESRDAHCWDRAFHNYPSSEPMCAVRGCVVLWYPGGWCSPGCLSISRQVCVVEFPSDGVVCLDGNVTLEVAVLPERIRGTAQGRVLQGQRPSDHCCACLGALHCRTW